MDPISNLITSIKNAIANHKTIVVVPHSKLKISILEVLKKLNYIADFKQEKLKNNKSNIKVTIKYTKDQPNINHIKVISTPGLRIYKKSKEIPRVLGGIADIIISTPKGVMTGKQAKAKKLGGELICEVY